MTRLFLLSTLLPIPASIAHSPRQRRHSSATRRVLSASSANASASAAGAAIPLNYVLLSNNQGYEQQLTVALTVAGESTVQNVLVDTGSSSLAFCDGAFANLGSQEALETDYAQCNLYGGDVTCSDGQVGSNIGWVGSVYRGNVTVYDVLNDEDLATMENVHYSIMDKDSSFYPCDGPMSGILGVAFSGLNVAYEVSGDFNYQAMSSQICTQQGMDLYACNTQGLEETTLDAPLEQVLMQSVEEGKSSESVFGLYCDYAATSDADYNVVVPGTGMYFGGDMALENEYYMGGTPQTAAIPSVGDWYNVNLQKISIPTMGITFTYDKGDNDKYCNPSNSNCYTDSGTSYLAFPITQNDCDAIRHASEEQLSGNLEVYIEGSDGGTVTLTFPLSWIVQQADAGWIRFTDPESSGSFVLGFPVFQFYYVVYNMGLGTLTFVDLPQREGRELGSRSVRELLGKFPAEVCNLDVPSDAFRGHVSIVTALLMIVFLGFS